MTLQAGAFTTKNLPEKKISPLRFCQVQGDEAWTNHEKRRVVRKPDPINSGITLPEAKSLHLQMDQWMVGRQTFPLGMTYK